jgi:hypothetical protein
MPITPNFIPLTSTSHLNFKLIHPSVFFQKEIPKEKGYGGEVSSFILNREN